MFHKFTGKFRVVEGILLWYMLFLLKPFYEGRLFPAYTSAKCSINFYPCRYSRKITDKIKINKYLSGNIVQSSISVGKPFSQKVCGSSAIYF